MSDMDPEFLKLATELINSSLNNQLKSCFNCAHKHNDISKSPCDRCYFGGSSNPENIRWECNLEN